MREASTRPETEISEEESEEEEEEPSSLHPQPSDNADEDENEYSYSYEDEEHEGSSSSVPVKPKRPKMVANRYEVGRKLGAGSYSEVFAATDVKTGDPLAVKMEWQRAEKTDKLLAEAELYKELGREAGIPRVWWSGSQGEYNLMILDMLGPSLDDLFKKQRKFSVKTVVMIAKQVITRLEHVHKRGILYRDIKPHNFLTGVGEKGSKRVYLVDFGLSKRYLDAKTGEHYKCKFEKGRGIAGTVRYSSPFLHEGYEASRRDDLFALGYVLMHLLRGELPWLDISHKDKKVRNKRIGQKKADIPDKELCRGFPRQFVEYFRYLRSLDFYDEPDYARLQDMMDTVLEEAKLKYDLVYDWTEDADRPAKKRKLRA